MNGLIYSISEICCQGVMNRGDPPVAPNNNCVARIFVQIAWIFIYPGFTYRDIYVAFLPGRHTYRDIYVAPTAVSINTA